MSRRRSGLEWIVALVVLLLALLVAALAVASATGLADVKLALR
ncbi:hypothetical protein [Actinoplanes sp. GCM10030250]